MYTNSFYFLFDADEYTAFIKTVEKQFRDSYEYRLWLNTVVRNRHMCAATGMTKEDDGIDIEIHHYGITLWGWIEKILDSFHDHEPELPVNGCYICLILSDIHLSNCVPYVPLMHCMHKKLHRGDGGVEAFLEQYPEMRSEIYHGNISLAEDIIKKHIDKLVEILRLENLERQS